MLKPAPNDFLQRWPVSKRVNSLKADGGCDVDRKSGIVSCIVGSTCYPLATPPKSFHRPVDGHKKEPQAANAWGVLKSFEVVASAKASQDWAAWVSGDGVPPVWPCEAGSWVSSVWRNVTFNTFWRKALSSSAYLTKGAPFVCRPNPLPRRASLLVQVDS